MRKKIAWMVVGSLLALSLVIAACAPAPATPTKPAPTAAAPTTAAPTTAAPTARATPTPGAPTAPVAEKPKYGGTLRIARSLDIKDFDEVVGLPYSASLMMITNDSLWGGDWTKGPAGGYGTNETDWSWALDVWAHKAGYLAEKWEFNVTNPNVSTMTWYIRQGVRWAVNPNSEASRLVNGREVTADDVVFSLKQVITDQRGYVYKSFPELRPAKITATDKYTVKIEVEPLTFESAVSRFGETQIVPPEVVQKLGDMNDWKRSVGTGTFMLTEFVPASSATLVRNPNFWGKDPIGPGKGNQLPYMDGVKVLIIPDTSTRIAALRTGKVDVLAYGASTPVEWEDAVTLQKQVPQLKSLKTYTGGAGSPISMRVDKPELPFYDKRVRRAMFMATDFEAIKKNLYGGEAQIVTWPIGYDKAYASAYLGLDDPQMPASVKELYTYNPEKAKQLLKEAGYPNGFKTSIVIANIPSEVDYYSILKDMWAKVGIDLTLDSKEAATRTTIMRNLSHEQMIRGDVAPTSFLYKLVMLRQRQSNNASMINDPVVEEYFPKIQRAAGSANFDEANRLHKELMKYALDQAWVIPTVKPPQYHMWWPWLKNYSGEGALGYYNRHFLDWVWIDEALKKSMGF
ncbi:MAG: ABC transporter substrate-binding protein [Chloroflexi bacterium]|nr:ABC transporter substrate-binding protein [Chloroflexota bacterium]